MKFLQLQSQRRYKTLENGTAGPGSNRRLNPSTQSQSYVVGWQNLQQSGAEPTMMRRFLQRWTCQNFWILMRCKSNMSITSQPKDPKQPHLSHELLKIPPCRNKAWQPCGEFPVVSLEMLGLDTETALKIKKSRRIGVQSNQTGCIKTFVAQTNTNLRHKATHLDSNQTAA